MNHAPPADALRGPTESAAAEGDQPAAPDGPRHPRLIMFDVNETLSDMSVLAGRFAELGLSQQLAPTWFAGLLRDGFALTVTGENPDFADVASDSLVSLRQLREFQRSRRASSASWARSCSFRCTRTSWRGFAC